MASSRQLGQSEFPLYPASQTGQGDMFLHLAFTAPDDRTTIPRIELAWAILRARHPVLAATVQPDPHGAHFSYSPPSSIDAALSSARLALSHTDASKSELITTFMDGPRYLADDHLSHLTLSRPDPSSDAYDLLLVAPHFTGDATPLHQSAHDFLALIASDATDEELRTQLGTVLAARACLPPSAEAQLPPAPTSRWRRAAAQINYLQTLAKEVGGHTLPREQHGPKRTLMLERALEPELTKAILARCKANGVSVNHAIFALVNVVWARVGGATSPENPVMMYTALNLRAQLTPPTPDTSNWFLALTYANVVLPSYWPQQDDPSASHARFWLRARNVRAQLTSAARPPFFVERARLSAVQRRSRVSPPPPAPATSADLERASTVSIPPADALQKMTSRAPAPSAALLGVSLIGNLDRVYDPAAYHARVRLQTVTTASRLKPGGVLLLAHTFVGRLWLHLCIDGEGFADGFVERFWDALGIAAQEFLVA